jgi:hypothetical protein
MTNSQRHGLLGLTLVALLLLGWLLAAQLSEDRGKTIDDSFITYVYARNLAEGHGVRFNPSDTQPTEGSSSLLQVFLVSGLILAGAEPLAASRMVSLLVFLAIPLGVGTVLSRVARVPLAVGLWSAVSVQVLLALLPETQWHLATGMETVLYSAIHSGVFAWTAFIALNRRRLSASAALVGTSLFALLFMSRPEGVVLGVGYLAIIPLIRWGADPQPGPRTHFRKSLLLWIPFVVAFGVFLAMKSSYFGQPLPNSYYVKFANGIFGTAGHWLPGLVEVGQFALQRALPLALLLGGVGLLLWSPRQVSAFALLLTPAGLMAILYGRVVHEAAGGFRYEYPLMLPLFVGLGLCAARVWQLRPLVFVWVTLFATVGVPLLSIGQSSDLFRWVRAPIEAPTHWLGYRFENGALARMGLDLGDTGLRQRATILLSGAGLVPYYSRFRSIDWLGLNEARLSGRHALSLDEVWEIIDSERPDVVYSFLPPATPGIDERERDPAFNSPTVQSSLAGRGSDLFSHWNPGRVAEMFYREMSYIRDHYEFGAVYELWGDWNLIAYVRRDSTHRDGIQAVLRNSVRDDHDIDLAPHYVNDPRSLGRPPAVDTRGAKRQWKKLAP